MARQKTVKRTAKRPSAKSGLVTLQKIEKDFFGTPEKLATHFAKEINVLKKRENKLNNTLNKTKKQLKTSEGRLKAAGKSKSANSKKQLKKAKTMHGAVSQTYSDTNQQLQEINKALTTASNKHARLIALQKNLKQFEKEWAKSAKSKTTAKVSKLKTKTKKTTRKRSLENAKPAIDQNRIEDFDTMMDDSIQQVEPAETA